MTTPATGSISIGNIRDDLGPTNVGSLRGHHPNIPASGPIALSQARGLTKMRFPPVALANYTTNVAGQSYGNGTYVASSSFNYDNNTTVPWKAFDYVAGIWSTGWSCVNRYNGSTGQYTGSTTTSVAGYGTASGEWCQLQLPYAIFLKSFSMQCRTDFSPNNYLCRMPNAMVVAGSNDGTTFSLLSSIGNVTWSNANTANVLFDVSSHAPYSYIRFIVQSCGNSDQTATREGADISEIFVYGF